MTQAPGCPRFAPQSALHRDLARRVDAYFAGTGLPRHGGASLRRKTAVVLAWLVASYLGLLLWASSWTAAVPLAVSLGLAVAGVGFTIQHDGGHAAYARGRRGNRLAAWALDLVGASSFVWHQKHVVGHHVATNLDGADDDVDATPFLRLAPTQRHRAHHRAQHVYAWPLLAFLVPKWNLWDDFAAVARGRIGHVRLPRMRPLDVAVFVGGKLLFAAWAFAVPLLAGHSVGSVLGAYAIAMGTAGVCLSIVFQLAHCVEEAEFPAPPASGERLPRPWAEHQLATTVDFAPGNPVLTWYLGGLNYQVEHHLFPAVSHVHYPALSHIVREVCAEHGVRHRRHPTLLAAVRSHAAHLRALSRPPRAGAA